MSPSPFRNRAHPASPPPAGEGPYQAAAHRYARRVHRARINLVVWAVGTVLLTALWVSQQWNANGAFDHFGHEGDPGEWNPTLWALGVGIWTLVVGLMVLQAYIERPATPQEVEREIARTTPAGEAAGPAAGEQLRSLTRVRLERIRRLRFHVAAWVLGMVLLTPLWALIEWQDNGAFERWSSDSQPGSWDPWILVVGGIWALVIAILALWVVLTGRRASAG